MTRSPRRCGWCVVVLAVVTLASRQALAMTYRPISDENLVAASALVVIGEVEEVRGARLADGRIVTQADLRVDESLKGAAAPRVRVTEAGGRVGDLTVRIPGMPAFVPGERVLVFLRERADGTLGTTALSLAKYTITSGTAAAARRTVPDVDERELGQFTSRIRALAAGASSRPVTDGFGGSAAVTVDVNTEAFTLLGNAGNCDPTITAGCVGGRWFEARCGEPIVYATSGGDPTLGVAASRAVVQQALDAWSTAPGGSLDLVLGPDVPAVSSSLAASSYADFDGRSIVQFEDPFEIVPDLVSCQGVLALGGTVSTPMGRVTEGDTSYDRTLEGDVVVNQGTGGCLQAGGLAETLAHEIGHTLGFGHSSENESEPNADLRDALMYFLIHDDGRGASLRTDDLAALAFVYPPLPSEPTEAAAALRDASCLTSIDLWSSACFLDQDNLGGFPRAPLKKAARAASAARKAFVATQPKKQLKLLHKSDTQLAKAETKITRLAQKATLRPECSDALMTQLENDRTTIGNATLAVEAAGL